MMERDPTKRKVKPSASLIDFEDLEESSDDSDFRIEDHCEESDDDSIDSNVHDKSSGIDRNDDSDDSSDLSDLNEALSGSKSDANYLTLLTDTQSKKQFNPKDALNVLICSICLGDRSDATNEIIECDNCGVTVHEGCYGVQDSDSVSSTDSPTPTTPWFCDACKAGQNNPECELCPNPGGIFKETDVGKWVHLVCALYMPGVAFAEVDKLQSVTLFEMAYSKWGSKSCSLCPDQRFARTGVAVGCDAGMCKTHFHVTCGQREGLLAEAHSEEADQADPFYAHCKLHTDKTLIRKRRRNWLAVQMRMEETKRNRKETDETLRIQRRLKKSRLKYGNVRMLRIQPWVPTQKMARMITTSASACRALWRKAEMSGVDTEGWALRQAQVEALNDVHRRWHIQPSFSVEFIAYYLDRNNRVTSMRRQLAELLEENGRLLDDQSSIESKRDKVIQENTKECDRNKPLKGSILKYHDLITHLCPNKKLADVEMMGRTLTQVPQYSALKSMPTAAARKATFTGAISSDPDLSDNSSSADRRVCLNNVCGLCRGRHDQHLLAKCDTCHKHYHLACLNPPLTRMPKKTKLMGWQCSECDKDSSSSDVDAVDTEAPRKLRHKDNGDCSLFDIKIDSKDTSLLESSLVGDQSIGEGLSKGPGPLESEVIGIGGRSSKKRRREKHHRYSPDPGNMGSFRPHKHKHKRSKQQEEQRQSLKICFKSIPGAGGGSSYVATPSSSFVPIQTSPSTVVPAASPPLIVMPTPPIRLSAAKKKEEPKPLICVTCNEPGEPSNTVRCDECLLGFHFQCLDPPVKKSPKVRGYSWHCANCDPTESE